MKSTYINPQKLNDVISRMKYENGLAIRVCFATGLRLNDVLAFTYENLKRGNRFTIREQKTGKSRRVYVPVGLRRELLENAKGIFVFPHRLNADRPRTRQAVYIDFKKACNRSGFKTGGLSPHSVRKSWAVSKFAKGKSIVAIQKVMNHSNASVTALYALSDKL